MKLGKLGAILLLLVGGLLVPATTAQAAVASCAPTEEDRWLGTYNGPHHYHTGEEFGVHDIKVYRENGALRVEQYDGYSSPGIVTEEGELATGGGFLWGMRVTSATCGGDGNVTTMSGTWWLNYDPWCISCAYHGPFEAVRI